MKKLSLLLIMLYSVPIFGQTGENYSQRWTKPHGWHVMDVCFSPNGHLVLGIEGTVSANSVKLLESATGNIIWEKTASAKFGAFAPDMSKVFVAGSSTIAYNYPDGTQAWFNNEQCASFDLSSDGSKIVIGQSVDGANGKVILLNAQTGVEIWRGTTKGPVATIKFNSSGTRIVSGGGDTSEREVILWDVLSGSKIWTSTYPNKIQTVDFSQDGTKIIIGTDWQKVYLKDVLSGADLWDLTLTERFNDSGFSNDGTKVFLCQNNGYVRLFNTATGAQLWQIQLGNFVYLQEMDLSPDGSRIAVAGADKYLTVLDFNTGSILFRGELSNNVMSVDWSHDGSRIAAGTGYGGNVVVLQRDGATRINSDINLPSSVFLFQNYPNPFNPSTWISYRITTSSDIVITIIDILGREVIRLDEGEKAPGIYKLKINAGNLDTGVYFCRITAGQYTQTTKMLLLK